MNNKKKIMLPMIIGLLMVITVIGVTYAFFNYTRTGPVNAIRVGRIYFNHEEGDSISLENVFPISSEQAATDTTNAKTLSISVIGDTDYNGGIEYVVTLDSVNNTKNIPITLEVSVDGTGLGNPETGDYYTNRNNYTESKYKIEYNNKLENNNHILVGYISPNVNKGNIEGINGTINIKAYVDSSNVLISDTYPEGTVTIDGVEYYNGTPTTNKIVLTTEEWNSITGNNALSFKIKVEAREGIWVRNPNATAIFDTGTVVNTKLKLLKISQDYDEQDLTETFGFQQNDTYIVSFNHALTVPNNIEIDEVNNVISSPASSMRIYAWLEQNNIIDCNGTCYDAYWYSDANTVYLNENSSKMFKAINGIGGFKINQGNLINASSALNMSEMFYYTAQFEYSDIESWDVSNVTDMSKMFAFTFDRQSDVRFKDASSLNNWDVRNVQNFTNMFLTDDEMGEPSNFVYPVFTLRSGIWDNTTSVGKNGWNEYAGTYVPYQYYSTPKTASELMNEVQGLEEVDGAKRYVGSNPNNYVIFNNEQWRIVGLYGDNLKIVKASPAISSIMYDENNDNTWANSSLKTYLNSTYYGNLSETAQKMIAENTSWDVGTAYYNDTAGSAYTHNHATQWTGKIGLIASNEYLYAAGNNCRNVNGNSNLFETNCVDNDWLFPTLTGNSEFNGWMGPSFEYNQYVLYVDADMGHITDYNASNQYAASPVVYLKSNVKITGGTGASENAYILSYTSS